MKRFRGTLPLLITRIPQSVTPSVSPLLDSGQLKSVVIMQRVFKGLGPHKFLGPRDLHAIAVSKGLAAVSAIGSLFTSPLAVRASTRMRAPQRKACAEAGVPCFARHSNVAPYKAAPPGICRSVVQCPNASLVPRRTYCCRFSLVYFSCLLGSRSCIC